jgi:putative ABC transport system ATP-binding protein
MTVLGIYDVTKSFGSGALQTQALKGVTLEVAAGELVAVMGPSGSGKTTLLQVAGGLELPDTGRVEVEGADISALKLAGRATVRRKHVGYIFQNLNLISSLTAVENVALPLELDGMPTREAKKAALVALGDVELEKAADKFPSELSGGQQQRVAIARAVVGPRRIILADEPTGALDSVTGETVLKLLRGRVDAGAAGILVTHEARYAAWADRTIFLRDGLIVDDTGGRDDSRDLLVAP